MSQKGVNKKTWLEEREDKFGSYPALIHNLQKMVMICALLYLSFAIVATGWYDKKFPLQIWGFTSICHLLGIGSSNMAFRTGASFFFIVGWALYLVWCIALILIILAFTVIGDWRDQWQVDQQIELHVGWFLYGSMGIALFVVYTMFLCNLGILNCSKVDTK